MKVGSIPELVDGRDVITVGRLVSVRDAARIMTSKRIGAVLVLDEDQIVGIFTERDVMRRVVAEGLDPDQVAVGDVMTPNPQTVTRDDQVREVAGWMASGGYRHLPVVEEGHLVGIISLRDILVLSLTDQVVSDQDD
jgi:CBS domain-containing protein